MAQNVLVVGGGITGLATAVALQRRGFDVAVVESRSDSSTGAGISIWPNALAALDEIGLGDAVRESGGQVTAGALRWRDGTWLRRPAADRMVRALGEPLVVIRRTALTEILTAGLRPDTVEYGVAVQALDVHDGGVRARLSDGSVREPSAVVGADGVDSVVARHLNGSLPRRCAGYTAWRGVAECTIDPELRARQWPPGWKPAMSRSVPTTPIGSPLSGLRRATPTATASWVTCGERFGTWAEPIPTLLATTDPDQILRNDLYDRSPARRWARGPVVIAGDAAHPMRPHLGQGGCQGAGGRGNARRPRGPRAGSADCPLAGSRSIAPETSHDHRAGITVDRPGRESAPRGSQGAAATRATVLVPEYVLTRHLASIAARGAFTPVR